MNWTHFLVGILAVGFAVAIPWAIRSDRWDADMEDLDDEELAAVLAEFPDVLMRVVKP
jgi:hypothetical protein